MESRRMNVQEDFMGVAGLILGILAAIGGWIPGVNMVAWLLAIIGIVLSAVGMSKAKKAGNPAGAAVAGLILSIIGLIISLSGLLCLVVCLGAATAAAETGVERLETLGSELEAIHNTGLDAIRGLETIGSELEALGESLEEARGVLEALRGLGGIFGGSE